MEHTRNLIKQKVLESNDRALFYLKKLAKKISRKDFKNIFHLRPKHSKGS